MNKTETKNEELDYGINRELLSFVKTKSIFPNTCKNNIFNTNLNDNSINTCCDTQENNNNIQSVETILSKSNGENIDYHLDEVGNDKTKHSFLLQEIALLLTKLCEQINLKDTDKNYLIKGMSVFLESFLNNMEAEYLGFKNVLFFHFKKIWGDEFQNKILLIKRASNWLGLNNLESNEEYLNFLYKMTELGMMLTEDQSIKNEHHSFVLTKEEAKKERNALISDDKFKHALTNKMHPLHKDVLNKLRNLNNIIVS